MSWDAALHCAHCGHAEYEVNHTDNTNGMVVEAMEQVGLIPPSSGDNPFGEAIGPAWWTILDGLNGNAGRDFLSIILDELRSDPARYAMNAANGWGSRDSLIQVFQEMCNAVPDSHSTAWRIYG